MCGNVSKQINNFFPILPLLTCVVWQINATSTADKQKVENYLWLNLFVLFRFPFSKAWKGALCGSGRYARIKFSTEGLQGRVDNIYCPQLCFGSINLSIFSPPLPIEITSNNYSKCIINSSSERQDQMSRLHLSQAYSFFQCPRGANKSLFASWHTPRSYFLQATTPRLQKERGINPLLSRSPTRFLLVTSRL